MYCNHFEELLMLPTHYPHQSGQGLVDYARRPITITIPKRDWLQLMQVCQAGCEPDLAEWLADEGIGTISLNPDTVVDTWLYLGKHMASKAAA